MMPTPFSLRIFVADGDPDGLRIVERSNWVGRALVFTRAAWAYHTRIRKFQKITNKSTSCHRMIAKHWIPEALRDVATMRTDAQNTHFGY